MTKGVFVKIDMGEMRNILKGLKKFILGSRRQVTHTGSGSFREWTLISMCESPIDWVFLHENLP